MIDFFYFLPSVISSKLISYSAMMQHDFWMWKTIHFLKQTVKWPLLLHMYAVGPKT